MKYNKWDENSYTIAYNSVANETQIYLFLSYLFIKQSQKIDWNYCLKKPASTHLFKQFLAKKLLALKDTFSKSRDQSRAAKTSYASHALC